MNEQVKYIWQKASSSHSQASTSRETQENFINRFTELVVTECINSLSNLRGYSGVGNDGNPYDTSSWNAALIAAQNTIKERFTK